MKFLFRTPLLPFFLVPLLIGEPVWAQTPVLPSSDETGGGSNLQVQVVSSDGSRIAAGSRSMKGLAVQVTDPNGAGVPEAAVAFRLPDSGPSGTFADGSHSAVVYTDNAGKAHVDGIQWNPTPGTAILRITVSKGNDHAGILVEQTLISQPAGSVAATAAPLRSRPLPPPSTALEEPVASSKPVGVPAAPSISVESIGRKGVQVVNPLSPAAEPSVSIVSSPQERLSSGSSKKKWIILGIAIAAGAGAGFAMAGKGGNSGSTAASTSSISFGSPTVSVGHP